MGSRSITNTLTGVTMKIKAAMAPNDEIEVIGERGKKRVTWRKFGGDAVNAFPYIAKGSDFLDLAVGDNYLRYAADDGYSNLDVPVSFDYRYPGF